MSLSRLPYVGETVLFSDGALAKVTEVKSNNIVWVQYLDAKNPGINKLGATCFIGKFADGTFNRNTTIVVGR